MKNSQRLCGLEWRSAGARWCAVENRKGRWEPVEQFEFLWQDRDPTTVMKEFVSKNNLQDRMVALALPRENVLLTWDERTRQLETALAPNFLSAYEKALTSAGLRLNGVGFGAAAQLIALSHLTPPAHAGPLAILDLEPDQAQFTLAQNGAVLFCRTLSPDETLCAEIKKTAAQAAKTRALAAPTTLLLLSFQTPEAAFIARLSSELNVDVVVERRALAAAGQALGRIDGRAAWLSPPVAARGVWEKHRDAALAAVAIAFTATAMYVNGHIDRRPRERPPQQTQGLDPMLSLLIDATQRVPKNAHLVTYDYDRERRAITLKGRAADYGAVSEFVSALARAARFRDARAEKATLLRIGERAVVEFSVEAKL